MQHRPRGRSKKGERRIRSEEKKKRGSKENIPRASGGFSGLGGLKDVDGRGGRRVFSKVKGAHPEPGMGKQRGEQ